VIYFPDLARREGDGVMNPFTLAPDVDGHAATPSRVRLAAIVCARSVLFVGILGVLLFLPAGTWRFWQGWVFAAFYMTTIIAFLFLLVIVDPQTVARRLESNEREPTQRKVARYLTPIFLLAMIGPGLDHRFGWTRRVFGPVPEWVSLTADFVALAGVLLGLWTVWVNRYAARTIRVEESQTVINSGPYGLIRHPMYAGIILAQLAIPLTLGSIVTVPLFALLIPFFIVRLLNEEKVLARDLPGYPEYCRSTRSRLIPWIW
jgi:protein-S-isoprenylcysteine O-methyltransferase Ste14